MRARVAHSRKMVGAGHPVATVARTLQVSRQAVYRRPTPRLHPTSLKVTDEIEQAIVDHAGADENRTDGYRMVAAMVSRKLGQPVNRKRALRVMRKHRLIQRRRSEPRPKRPGYFKVHRPAELWHLDMTSIWVGELGWCYLMAMIDCCTREITGWSFTTRCRAIEAVELIERGARVRGVVEGQLTLGTDNGSAFTARRTRAAVQALGISHRRGGYRDPESQAFIESWFGKLKEREVWPNEYETLEDGRLAIGRYIDRYHDRPHSGLAYRTPNEVAASWREGQSVQNSAV